MPLNPAKVGAIYPSFRYEVSREKVREYALATGLTDDRYLAQTGEVIAPPTFAACFTITRGASFFGDPDLGAHAGVVHGAQEYVLHRPLRVGDVLSCTPTITGITVRGRNEFLSVEIAGVDAGTGDAAVTSRGTFVFLGSAATEGG